MEVQWLPSHPCCGVRSMWRYWKDLQAEALLSQPDLHIRCPFPVSENVEEAAGRSRRAISRYIVYSFLARFWTRPGIVHILDHSIAHIIPWLPKGCRTIVTVHDLVPILIPEEVRPHQYRRFCVQMENLRRAHHLIAVSEFTAGTIVEQLGISRDKITVVPNGVTISNVPQPEVLPPEIESLIDPKAPTIKLLLVGSVVGRKNLNLLPPVIAALRQAGYRPSVWRAGALLDASLKAQIIGELERESDFIEFGTIDDSTLVGLYQRADVYLMPSTFEGFGLPVLEAMAHGCPVVSSNTTSLPEAGGDAALYFDPHDAAAAAARIIDVITQPGPRAGMIERGLAHARSLTWARTLEGFLDVYRRVGE